MSGLDREIFNNLERALSTDVNDLQSLKDRAILDELGNFGLVEAQVQGLAPFSLRKNVVAGMRVTPSASVDEILIAQGAVVQYSTSLSPVPGPIDSPYRCGYLRATRAQATPVPAGTTYYLLEVQMVEVVTSSSLRDIFNPGTQTFSPVLVAKQAERQVAFQLVAGAGGQAPVPTGGNWVPVALVRRPAGGGLVLQSDIVDVRTIPHSRGPGGFEDNLKNHLMAHRLETVHVPDAAASFQVRLNVEALVDGQRCYFHGTVDPTTTPYIDPTTVLVGDSWFYLYLFQWSAGFAAGSSTPGFPGKTDALTTQRGILVLSSVPPDLGGTVNLPAPWNATALSLGAGRWILVGALRTNSANTGFSAQQTQGDEQLLAHEGGGGRPFQLYSPPATSQTLDLRTLGPRGVDALRLFNTVSGNTTALSVIFAEANTASAGWDFFEVDVADDRATDSTIVLQPKPYVIRLNAPVPGILRVEVKGYKLKQFDKTP